MSEKTAYFAAGCFWGVEDRFRKVPGVSDAISGYMGGHVENPTYRQVCNGDSGHTETVKVVFDENQVSYSELLDLFFEMHNPTTLNRQGPDFGSQYRSAVFVEDEEQGAAVRKKITDLDASCKWHGPVVTEVTTDAIFWPAEEHHQRYFEKNGAGHCAI